jgi:hypothetical protein
LIELKMVECVPKGLNFHPKISLSFFNALYFVIIHMDPTFLKTTFFYIS